MEGMRNRPCQKKKNLAQIAEDRLEFLVVDGDIILKWKLMKV
jgi:hypothetical protein